MMNKKEMAAIYKKLCPRKITIQKAQQEMEEILKVMEKALVQEGKITFTKIGVMEIVNLKPRRIADPNTKEPVMIYPPKDVRFKESLPKRKR